MYLIMEKCSTQNTAAIYVTLWFSVYAMMTYSVSLKQNFFVLLILIITTVVLYSLYRERYCQRSLQKSAAKRELGESKEGAVTR